MSGAPLRADVVIVGGGPVGSLIAYQLARFGCKPYLIEQDDKKTMTCYGRASTMWPRTIEILDQLDLAERLLQIGVVTRNALHFRDGRRSTGGLMYGSRMDKLGCIFANASRRNTLKTVSPITVRIRDLNKDEPFEVKTKYLIGADGGKSAVRSLTGIPFNGERTMHRWIRMDARVKTNMPNPRCLNSIDSKFHGQILWCPIDDGLTRIGYVFSQALLEKLWNLLSLEFLEVNWFTIYVRYFSGSLLRCMNAINFQGIGQAIAETFTAHDRIFLAGDACHTHSSGSAQGLNTGVHDAVNLAWKLALNILDLGKKSLIDSYNEERKPCVQQVIDNDKVISTLISGQYPPRFEGRKEHPRDILTEWYTDVNIQLFTLGLGISYPTNLLNSASSDPSAATIVPGERGPDVYLVTIGMGDPIRLHQVLKNDAKFHIVVFAGNPSLSRSGLVALKMALEAPTAFTRAFPARRVFRFTTIAAAYGNSTTDVLGMPAFGGGRAYWDAEGCAHGIYGVDEARGAIIVFRPDGWVGCVVALEDVQDLASYFENLLVSEA
ncbi:Pentachlorophenol 4-monooxygenase [Mycena venus]|uniref:Pentachlorophenol 4-monooxygenase n=1 Tax=Mycena venus TaxID=2733690 RepID=A0A8H6WXD5_9AGAR|nr:Pentachlorophenol 4-monooxygenase [Mycena venus]